jgi:hypothetical protein
MVKGVFFGIFFPFCVRYSTLLPVPLCRRMLGLNHGWTKKQEWMARRATETLMFKIYFIQRIAKAFGLL